MIIIFRIPYTTWLSFQEYKENEGWVFSSQLIGRYLRNLLNAWDILTGLVGAIGGNFDTKTMYDKALSGVRLPVRGVLNDGVHFQFSDIGDNFAYNAKRDLVRIGCDQNFEHTFTPWP